MAGGEKAAGPGFPEWYQDANGLKLSGAEGEPDPADPTAPPETIYWAGEASLPAGGEVSGDLIMGLTGYYANDVATPGEEITAATIKVNIRGLTPGQSYTITHPYGTQTLTASDKGRIVEVLEETGCDPHVVEAGGSCNFAEALNSSIGPFLVWNPAVSPAALDDLIGDPDVAHEVVGSPNNTNFFKVEGPGLGTPETPGYIQTDLFNITGEVDGLAAFASLKGGTFEEAQSVTLAPSNSGASIFYTTDGSDPTNSATRVQYAGPVNVAQTSTLKFVAIGAGGQSPVLTERYVITPPTSLSLNASSSVLSYGQTATLSGQLSTNGTVLADKPVILEEKAAGASDFSPVGEGQPTDAQGNFFFALKPEKNTAYRVSFAGEPEGFKPSLSATKQLNVKALVSNNTATTDLKLGKVRNVVGKVSPAHAGQAVKMTIKRPGQPELVRNLRLSDTSNYKFSYKPNEVGRYSVSVQFAGDADHLGGKSVAKSFRVIR